jgi:hypothetical protein
MWNGGQPFLATLYQFGLGVLAVSAEEKGYLDVLRNRSTTGCRRSGHHKARHYRLEPWVVARQVSLGNQPQSPSGVGSRMPEVAPLGYIGWPGWNTGLGRAPFLGGSRLESLPWSSRLGYLHIRLLGH